MLASIKSNASEFSENIALLFARIGYETGQFKRALDENQISWGYFIDHNLFEPHCNAHPNNFLVLDLLSPSNPSNLLLAPLDFDMAYNLETFVNIVEDSPDFGRGRDAEMFDNWSGLEKYELEKALGGQENMANFSYGDGSTSSGNGVEAQKGEGLFKVTEIGLRDTCVK